MLFGCERMHELTIVEEAQTRKRCVTFQSPIATTV